ncbi:MFS transporter [Streptomyces longisporoflavus]|uniref:MFS transporter n=1 Tax=Streptomyces longisporoflavus TaxID=28044 RepID=A0ABW7R2A2_9ACTN
MSAESASAKNTKEDAKPDPSLAGPLRVFVVVSLLDSLGTGLYLAGSAVYFVRMVGLSPAQLGLGMTIAGCAGFLATVPIGLLADRLGAKRVLTGLQLWLAVAFTALAFVDGPLAFAVVCSLMVMAECSAPPMIQAVVADLMRGSGQVKAMARIRTVRNIGYAAGSLLAVPLMATDTRWAFQALLITNAASYVVAAVLLRGVKLRATVRAAVRPPRAPRRLRPELPKGLGDRRFLAVTGINGVLVLHSTVLNVGLPLWIVENTKAPVVTVPLLFTLNSVLVIGLQMRFSRGADTPGRSRRVLYYAGVALAATCVLFALSSEPGPAGAVVLLTLAVLALTAGELWQAIAGWALPVDHAPEGRRAEYLSVFNLGVTVQGILGPLVVTALLTLRGTGWLLLAGAFALCAVLAGPLVAALERSREAPEEGAPEAGAAVSSSGDAETSPDGAVSPTGPPVLAEQQGESR